MNHQAYKAPELLPGWHSQALPTCPAVSPRHPTADSIRLSERFCLKSHADFCCKTFPSAIPRPRCAFPALGSRLSSCGPWASPTHAAWVTSGSCLLRFFLFYPSFDQKPAPPSHLLIAFLPQENTQRGGLAQHRTLCAGRGLEWPSARWRWLSERWASLIPTAMLWDGCSAFSQLRSLGWNRRAVTWQWQSRDSNPDPSDFMAGLYSRLSSQSRKCASM